MRFSSRCMKCTTGGPTSTLRPRSLFYVIKTDSVAACAVLTATTLVPRAGIAYQANSKTVVRTGFGVSYTEQYDGGTQLYKNLPFLVTQRFTYDQNGAPG